MKTAQPERIDIFLNPTSQFGVLDAFAVSLQKALRRARIASRSFNIFTQSREQVQKQCEKTTPQCTLGFNVILGPHVLYESLGVPHIALMVDCASYLPQLFDCYNCIAAYVDRDSCRYAEYFGHKSVLWVPHAIDKSFVAPKNVRAAMQAKRDLDVVFCGSFIDPDEIWLGWKLLFSKKVIRILEGIVDEVLASSHIHHFDVFKEAYQKYPDIQKEMQKKDLTFHNVVSSLDKCIRGRDRVALLKSMQSCDVHIFTPANDIPRWKTHLGESSHHVFHEALSFDGLAEKLQRAKVVINSAPMMKHGFHERLFLSLAQGASVITNHTDFLEGVFRKVGGVRFYRAPQYADVAHTIDELLSNENTRLKEVAKAQEMIRKEHTWDARVEMLCEKLPQLIAQVSDKR